MVLLYIDLLVDNVNPACYRNAWHLWTSCVVKGGRLVSWLPVMFTRFNFDFLYLRGVLGASVKT